MNKTTYTPLPAPQCGEGLGEGSVCAFLFTHLLESVIIGANSRFLPFTLPKMRRTVRRRSARRVLRRRRKTPEALKLSAETRRQISGFVQLALAAVTFLIIQGNAGIMGEGIMNVLTFFFGSASMLLPIVLTISGLFLLAKKDSSLEFRSAVGLSLCLVALLGFIHIQAPFEEIGAQKNELGGAIGFMISFPLLAFTSVPVAYVVLSALFLIGLLVAFETSPTSLLKAFHNFAHPKSEEEPATKGKSEARKAMARAAADAMDVIEKGMKKGDQESGKNKSKKEKEEEEERMNIVRPAFMQEELGTKKAKKPIGEKPKFSARNPEDEDIGMNDTHFDDWEFPSLDCLDQARSEVMVDDATLKSQAALIEEKLKEFDVAVTVREAHPGPTVTQFALEPAEGVKLSRIANLKNDLALALAAPSLRIEAPIPGKSLVGIEMPNIKRTTVHLREILESPEFRESESSLSLPFGRDVSGKSVVYDLADMPHLLIAGATGSGKSVCMNTFLISLLYQNAPHELKFILIDPKRVELSLYDGIPHLLTPVITESEKALKALRWVVAEMGRRLARFSEAGARNLHEFNEKQEDDHKKMPRIIVVIDELADLMMRQFRRDTEMMITRIAQIARAAGIHLIIATQRPSVDVITGVIKANIPTRIGFRTVSSIDSRTILDTVGAEDLLGKGDMLYIMAHTPMPVRVQGILVSSKEVEKVINHVKIAGGGKITAQINMGQDRGSGFTQQGQDSSQLTRGFAGTGGGSQGDDDDTVQATGVAPIMVSGGYAGDEGGAPSEIDLDADDDGGDDLTFEAIELVKNSRKASASLLQRHLKVGYARAARLLDILEQKGVVGPVDGAKPRKVYVE